MVEEYTKEVVEPAVLDEPVSKLREGLIDLFHDTKDERVIELLHLTEVIKHKLNGG
jgi:hypothetical protein